MLMRVASSFFTFMLGMPLGQIKRWLHAMQHASLMRRMLIAVCFSFLAVMLCLTSRYIYLRYDWPIAHPWPAIQETFTLLLPDVIWVFPAASLPFFLAVRTGLEPLRKLSQHVAQRSPENLSPIDIPGKYLELQPLVDALNQLMHKVRRHLDEERHFVQDAAHELRTPIAVIASQTHVVCRQLTRSTDAHDAALLEQAVQRACRVVQQLLDLAELDRDTPHAAQSLTWIDLAATARGILGEVAIRAQQAGLSLNFTSPEHMWRPADAAAFSSVLHNWCDNALQHGPSAGGGLDITLSALDNGGWTLRVEDDGPGIPPADQAALFERFRRGSAARGNGCGLGMAISQQAARRLGATVHVISPVRHDQGCALELRQTGQMPTQPPCADLTV